MCEVVVMLFSELEGSTLEELIDGFRGPPLDGEEYRSRALSSPTVRRSAG